MTPRLALVLLAGLTLSCGGGGSSPTSPSTGGSAGTTSCTTLGQCTFVRDALRDYYYWYKELPSPDPASFSSPEAYLDAVRYRPLDSSFSYVTSKASSDAFYSDSQFIGFGLSYKRTGDLELRLAQAFPGSPAADAGMDRGDTLLTIAGKAVADLIRTGEINTVFGAEQEGVTVAFTWRDLAGREKGATLVKRKVTIPTVSQTAVLNAGSSRVGYIHFRNFVQPSVEALNTAFTQVREAGATELVLDLRYNGGGLVSVSQHLAGLIGGPPLVGPGLRAVHPQRQAVEPQHRLPVRGEAAGPRRLAARGHHHPRLRLRQRGHRQRPAPVHGREGGGRHDLRQAGGPVRLRLLREGALPGVLPGDERARRGRLLQRHPGRLRRRRTTWTTRSPTPARPRSRRPSTWCGTAAAAAPPPRRPRCRPASASASGRSRRTAGARPSTPGSGSQEGAAVRQPEAGAPRCDRAGGVAGASD